eukprot:12919188-Prorocentrum_lima.AAC.1
MRIPRRCRHGRVPPKRLQPHRRQTTARTMDRCGRLSHPVHARPVGQGGKSAGANDVAGNGDATIARADGPRSSGAL